MQKKNQNIIVHTYTHIHWKKNTYTRTYTSTYTFTKWQQRMVAFNVQFCIYVAIFNRCFPETKNASPVLQHAIHLYQIPSCVLIFYMITYSCHWTALSFPKLKWWPLLFVRVCESEECASAYLLLALHSIPSSLSVPKYRSLRLTKSYSAVRKTHTPYLKSPSYSVYFQCTAAV